MNLCAFFGKYKNHTGFSSKFLRSYLTKQNSRHFGGAWNIFCFQLQLFCPAYPLDLGTVPHPETSLTAYEQSTHFRLSEQSSTPSRLLTQLPFLQLCVLVVAIPLFSKP